MLRILAETIAALRAATRSFLLIAKALLAYYKALAFCRNSTSVGVFELPTFAKGTIEVGNFVAEATKNGAFSLVGGGDSVAAVKQFGFENKVNYVSTGSGAMLESLKGLVLPGIQTINE